MQSNASRAIWAPSPPTVVLCHIGHHHDLLDHQRTAAAEALSRLEATGAVTAHHADDAAGCSSSNATVLPIAAGHTWALPQLWPFCFYNWRAPNFRLATIPPHLASTDTCDAPSSFRLAIGLGGLARTLPHPLVYKTLRGHIIEPWNKTHSSRRQQATQNSPPLRYASTINGLLLREAGQAWVQQCPGSPRLLSGVLSIILAQILVT